MHARAPLLLLTVLLAGAAEQEVFILRDGRELTGTWDAEAGVIHILVGRISGAVPVAPGDIVQRRPVVEPKGELVTLVLRDGRRVSGRYDDDRDRLELVGAIRGTLVIPADDIVERLPYEGEDGTVAPDPRRDWDAEITVRLDALRRAERALVLARDALAAAVQERHHLGGELAVHARNRERCEARYRSALAARQVWIEAHPGRAIPEDLQQAVRDDGQLLRSLIAAVAGFEADLEAQASDIATARHDLDLAGHEAAKQRQWLAAAQAAASAADAATHE